MVILLGLLVVQLMLDSINDHHTMLNSHSDLFGRCILQSHVCDQVRNNTHLLLLLGFLHQPNTSLTFR